MAAVTSIIAASTASRAASACTACAIGVSMPRARSNRDSAAGLGSTPRVPAMAMLVSRSTAARSLEIGPRTSGAGKGSSVVQARAVIDEATQTARSEAEQRYMGSMTYKGRASERSPPSLHGLPESATRTSHNSRFEKLRHVRAPVGVSERHTACPGRHRLLLLRGDPRRAIPAGVTQEATGTKELRAG